MNYYNANNASVLTEMQIRGRGLPVDNQDALRAVGIFPVIERKPELNPHFETVQPGRLYREGEVYVQQYDPVPLPVAMVGAELKKQVTARRWEAETGGVTLPDGTRILTGIDDQNRISSALTGLREAPEITSIKFKTPNGWAELTPAQLADVSKVIAAHVQACFARECALYTAIDACESIEALTAIDLNSGWPGQADGADSGGAA